MHRRPSGPMLAEFRSLLQNWISVAGGVITSFAAVLFTAVFLFDLFGFHTNPYIGIVFFLIVPGIFLIGLLICLDTHAGMPSVASAAFSL